LLHLKDTFLVLIFFLAEEKTRREKY